MTEPTLEKLAAAWRLKEAWRRVRGKGSAGGADGVSISDFERDESGNLAALSRELLSGGYAPEPLRAVELAKPGKDEKRVIGLPALKNKIVHTALAEMMSAHWEPQFSNCSYAYRRGKGTVKAIGRVRDFLKQKNYWISAVDIDNFFDTINHDKCLQIVSRRIKDEGIIRIIKLYLAAGMIRHDRWEDAYDGVPQGGVLSPTLSNIYLNELDRFLHDRNVSFVRYADDIVMLGRTKEKLTEDVRAAVAFLRDELRLSINETDDPVMNVSRGFMFLGVFFHKGRIKIDYNRMDEKIEKIAHFMKRQRNFDVVIRKVNEFFLGVSRYYARLMPGGHQLDILENRTLTEISAFIARGKAEGFVETKKMCREKLAGLVFITDKNKSQKETLIEKIIQDGFIKYKQTVKDLPWKTDDASVQAAVGRKRQQYARKIATETELVVSRFGHFIGYNQRMFTVKHKGVTVASLPKNRLRRIVINSRGVTISSDCIHQCTKRNINIEFLTGRGEPYAMLYSPQFAVTRSSEMQMRARDGHAGIFLACQFLKGKAKNQINLLKYFNKYLKRSGDDEADVIEANIKQMAKLYKKLKPPAGDIPRETQRNQLMGLEGNISHYYWESVKLLLPGDALFEKRVTRGARDLVNSTLNYGYGILYNRVQQALADAGAALYVSFLHEPQGKKPTLVFDLIEEFRQAIVDRTVIAMFNRQEPLNTDKKGFLTTKSRELIVKNVQERLGSYVHWRKKRWMCEDIIFHQAKLLMHHVNGEKKYRAFIGRY